MTAEAKFAPIESLEIDLRPLQTFDVRKVIWKRYTNEGFRVAGVLSIYESRKPAPHHARPNKVYERRYSVLETNYDRGRRFVVFKPGAVYLPDEMTEDKKYFVTLVPHGFDRCTCRGFQRQGGCSHAESLRAALNNRGLPIHPEVPEGYPMPAPPAPPAPEKPKKVRKKGPPRPPSHKKRGKSRKGKKRAVKADKR